MRALAQNVDETNAQSFLNAIVIRPLAPLRKTLARNDPDPPAHSPESYLGKNSLSQGLIDARVTGKKMGEFVNRNAFAYLSR